MDVNAHPIYRAVRCGFLEVRQLALLMAVVREPGLSVRDYAARICVPRHVVSRACSVLIEQDLVTGGKVDDDLRLRVLKPTGRGRDAVLEIVGQEFLDADPQPDSKGEAAANGPAPGGKKRRRRAKRV